MSELEDKNSTTKSPAETGNPLIHDLNAEPETPVAPANDILVGNLLVGQSGGPTAVINASVAGVIQEAGRHPDQIEEIYGGLNGIFGILHENLIDLNEEKARTIEELKHTPAAALGTCRYKIRFKKDPEQAAQDMDRLVLDITTDGSLTPRDALASAGATLRTLVQLVEDMSDDARGLELGETEEVGGSSPDLDLPIEDLDLSERPRNCLKRAQVDTIGQLLDKTEDDLLAVTNFGQKSLDEVIEKLDERGLALRVRN